MSPTDWWEVDQFLMQERGYRPWEIERLTLSEIICLCSSRDKPKVSDYEALDLQSKWENQSPEENLADALERYR